MHKCWNKDCDGEPTVLSELAVVKGRKCRLDQWYCTKCKTGCTKIIDRMGSGWVGEPISFISCEAPL